MRLTTVLAATVVASGSLLVASAPVDAGPVAPTVAATAAARPTELRILTVPHPGQTNHNGGQLMFGSGGNLYISTGDGGAENDSLGNAEKLTSALAKLLRIDVNHSCGSKHYCIPSG